MVGWQGLKVAQNAVQTAAAAADLPVCLELRQQQGNNSNKQGALKKPAKSSWLETGHYMLRTPLVLIPINQVIKSRLSKTAVCKAAYMHLYQARLLLIALGQ
jgi:hypothetical protein